jgi:hypothetical protein
MADTSDDGSISCSECGASRLDGLSCWEQLGLLIAWEYQDPELQAVHFLIVASYNFQHPAQFTDETLAGLRAVFIDYLDHGLGVPEIRRRVGKVAEGSHRVLRDEADRQPRLRHWPITIADVYFPNQPKGAADRVRAWALSIRNAF